MLLRNWLFDAMTKLGNAGVDSPRRDALCLLEDTLNKDRSWVLAHDDYNLSDTELKAVNKLIEQRAGRVPLAYVRGKAWFYGRFFKVTSDVLIPRPESEDFIDTLKELSPKTLLDVGTGSGCLAVTTKLELPGCEVTASDISPSALKIAQTNAAEHNADVQLVQNDLLENMLDKSNFDVVTANLPYVPDDLVTSPEILTEPKLALFAGHDGLELYRTFWGQISTSKFKPIYILTESLESQHDELSKLADIAGYQPVSTSGLVQLFKAKS